MPDRTGELASHIDQGRHSRFTARVLQRPARRHLEFRAMTWVSFMMS